MGRHLDALERRYDGTPPAAELARALKLDALAATTARPWTPPAQPYRKPPRPPALVTRLLADVMVARAAGSDACCESDLAAAGFTEAEIAANADAARALARRATDARGPR